MTGSVILNSRSFSLQTTAAKPDDWAKMLGLIAHEVVHIQQGALLAWSIQGEIEAWQMENRVYTQLSGKSKGGAWDKLMNLQVNSDPANLMQAQSYMRQVVGPGSSYPPAQDWFPLVPGWGVLVSPLLWYVPPRAPYGDYPVCFGNTCSE